MPAVLRKDVIIFLLLTDDCIGTFLRWDKFPHWDESPHALPKGAMAPQFLPPAESLHCRFVPIVPDPELVMTRRNVRER